VLDAATVDFSGLLSDPSHMTFYRSFLTTFSLDPLDPPMIIVMALLFTAFWKMLMARMVFLPGMQVLTDREEATVGLIEKAEGLAAEAASLQGRLAERLSQVRAEALARKAAELSRARDEAAQLLAGAEAQANELSDRSAVQTEQEVSAARERLAGEMGALSSAIVQRAVSAYD
jgi:F0F1-type ATP synthase membrane subunit b/b'